MKFKNLSLQKNLALIEPSTKRQYSLTEFLRYIDLNKTKLKKIETMLHGIFHSKLPGSGFDFNEIREYKIGDDLRHISWSATAKTGTLQTKEYFCEKEVRSYFLIDVSNSMFCGNKLDPFIQLTAFLLNISSNFSEKIGATFYSDDINHHFALAHAKTQANIIFQTFKDKIDFFKESGSNNSTNIFKALDFTKRYFSKKGLVFIISDFIYPMSNWEKIVYETAQKQNIYLFQIYDPLDFNLPKAGYISIIDPETKRLSFVNTDSKQIQERYYKLMEEKQKKLTNYLKTIGVNHLLIEKSDFM